VGRRYHGVGNGVVGLGMTHVWSTASLAQVKEDGRALRSSTMVGNDGAEAPWRTQRWCGDSREHSMMARAPERSMTAWALGKFLAT
jgi:hypothetical protein